VKQLLLSAVLLGLVAQAAPKVGNYRYWSVGPEKIFAGYTYQYQFSPAWSFDVTCDTTSACTSADYTPTATDTFTADPDQTPPGGVQNQLVEFQSPTYKAVNIGTNGNPAGYWNLFQATAKHGSTAQQVTITSTGTIRFYIQNGYNPNMQLRRPMGWPTGTHFNWANYYGTTVVQNCLIPPFIADPASYIPIAPVSGHVVRCVEVTIPANATPGSYNAGWEVCVDNAGNGCVQILKSITIEAPPVLTRATPAPVAMPTIYDQATPCLNNIVTGSQVAGTDCSFKHLASGGAEQNGASHWCTDRVNPDTTLEAANYWIGFSAVGSSAQTTGLGWFYDGPRVWYKTAAWFNDPLWENCGRAIAARYAQTGPGASGFGGVRLGPGMGNGTSSILGPYSGTDNYYSTIHSSNNLWALFPKGIEMGMSRFSRGKYSSTWVSNSWNPAMINELYNQIVIGTPSGLAVAGGGPSGTGYNVTYARENGYMLEPYISYRAAGGPLYKMVGNAPTLTNFGWHYFKTADALASDLLMYSQPGGPSGNNWGRIYNQTWMIVGPLIEAAINYFEQTHEPRMGMAIKGALDVVKSQYDWTQHAMPWVGAPEGPFCGGSLISAPDTEWYAGGGGLGNCGVPVYPEMDGMGAYAFAWAWKIGLGDDSYRQLADEMFTYGLIGHAALGYRWNPKAYYQMGKYQWEYLRHRLLAN